MTDTICPRCESSLPDDAPGGLCPECLLHGALEEPVTPTAAAGGEAQDPGGRQRYFGDYELLEEIGRGGMGLVFKARQTSLDRTVALKIVRAGRLASEPERERFQREARALARLRHPNIVTIHEVGEHEGQPFFAMDYVEGTNLADVVHQGPVDPQAAVGLVRRVAEAVHFAHQEGTLHRDLKPSNILLDAASQPRITDFGLAKRIDGEAPLTASGEMLGTPGYMPPEQMGGNGLSEPASDVYSLGAILYELVTGKRPFEIDNPLDAVMQVLHKEPDSPRVHNPEIDRDFETVTLKCLEKEPGRRYPSARELADDLGRYLRHEPLAARPVSWLERAWRWSRRNPWPAVAGVALLLLSVVAVFFSLTLRERLWRSLVDQARAERLAGRRASSLERIAEAARLKRSAELREEAVRTLITPGVELVGAFPFGTVRHLALSSDARLLALGGLGEAPAAASPWSESVHVWDVHGGTRLMESTSDVNGKGTFAFVPESPLLLLSRTTHRRNLLAGSRDLETAGAEKTEAVLWNPTTREEVKTIGLAEPENGLESYGPWIFGPGGKAAARRNMGQGVEIWDLDAGRAETIAIRAEPLAFFGDQDLLLLEQQGLVLHNLATSESTRLTPPPLAVSADGRVAVLAEAFAATAVRLPERQTLSLLPLEAHPPLRPDDPTPSRLVLSRDGGLLAVQEGEVWAQEVAVLSIWDLAGAGWEGSRLMSRIVLEPGSRIDMQQAAFSPDGALLAALGGRAATSFVGIWTVESGEEVARLEGHDAPLWSADGQLLATVGAPGPHRAYGELAAESQADGGGVDRAFAYAWQVAAAPPTYALSQEIHALAFSPGGGFLASNATVWKVRSARDRIRLVRSDYEPLGRTAHFDGGGGVWTVEPGIPEAGQPFVVVASRRDGRQLLLTHPGPRDLELPARDGAAYLARAVFTDLSPDGRYLAVSGRFELRLRDTAGAPPQGRFIDVWDLATRPPSQLWFENTLRREIGPVRFSPDGRFVAAADWGPDSRGVLLWDASTGLRLPALEGEDDPSVLVFGPDGEIVLSGEASGAIHVSSTSTGRRQAVWEGHRGELRAVAVSAGSRLAASGGDDRLIRLWDVATGRALAHWQGHEGSVTALAFDPTGETLASGGADGRLRLWHIPWLRRQLTELGLDWRQGS